VIDQVLTIVVSMGMSALGTVVVLKANMAWHKEKLDRHSESLARAFAQIEELRAEGIAKHDDQQREIHRLEIEIVRARRPE
jgi:hypothetical protein